MSSSSGDGLYKNLLQNLPEQVMPSAPIYEAIPQIQIAPENIRENRKEKMIPFSASSSLDNQKRLRIEAEIKKAQLRKEQLMKEKQLMEEEFKAKERLLDAEMELALVTIEGDGEGLRINNLNGVVQLENNTNSDKHNQALGYQNGDNANDRVERPIELPQPLGLEQLSILDEVAIRQLVSPSVDESYEVVSGDVVILRANLTFEVRNVALVGQRRVIKVDMFDSQVNEVINFRGGPTNFMELYLNGELVSLIQKAPTYFKPMLLLHDSSLRPVLKIKGPSVGDEWTVFSVQTIDKVNIGSVDKSLPSPLLTRGYVRETYTVVKFPLDLDVRFKAAVIASSFLLVYKKTKEFRKLKAKRAETSLRYLTSD